MQYSNGRTSMSTPRPAAATASTTSFQTSTTPPRAAHSSMLASPTRFPIISVALTQETKISGGQSRHKQKRSLRKLYRKKRRNKP